MDPEIDIFSDDPPAQVPEVPEFVQHQYTCAACGALRFVDVERTGYEFVKESCSMEFKIECPTCTERRDQFEAERKRMILASAQSAESIYIDRWIPPDYQQVIPSRLPMPEMWETLRQWVAKERGALLYGPPRKGKSRIAYAICARHMRNNVRTECYDCRTFRAQVERKIRDQSLWDWYEELQRLPLLMLDDLGKFKGIGKRIEEELFNVVKVRFEYRKPIIITTNLGPIELAKTFSGTIAGPLISRLDEMCDMFPFGPPETGLTPGLFDQKDPAEDDL